MKFYPKPRPDADGSRGYTEEDIRRGLIFLYADVKCTKCGKEQSYANGHNGCIRCGGECN